MLTRDGDVKVADYGLARVLLSDDPQLTRAGTTLGTPMYMSPEQIQEGQSRHSQRLVFARRDALSHVGWTTTIHGRNATGTGYAARAS